MVKEITVEANLLEDSHTPFYSAFAISPDGLRVAYSTLRADLEADRNNVYILQGNTSTTLELTKDYFAMLAWGPVGWRIRHSYSKSRNE